MQTFTFPKRDYKQHLKSIEANNGRGVSIRVSKEAHKYKKNQEYMSIYGVIFITDIKRYKSLGGVLKHVPNELTAAQQKILSKYNDFAVVYFELV